MPIALLRAHCLSRGTWGRIVVHDGQLRFSAPTEPALDVVLEAHSTQAIPPDVEHQVRPIGAVRFSIDFLAVDEHDRAGSAQGIETVEWLPPVPNEGGDPASRAGLPCPECGAVLDGGPHQVCRGPHASKAAAGVRDIRDYGESARNTVARGSSTRGCRGGRR